MLANLGTRTLCVGLGLWLGASSAAAQPLADADFDGALLELGSADPEKRIAAAELLGRRAEDRRDAVTEPLRRLGRADADWRVRASSLRALGRLGVRAGVPDLVAALRDPQVEVRVVAAAALWRLPDPAAVPSLVELLADQDPAARQWAALALGVIRDSRATAPLLGLLRDPVAEVRMDVIRSLGRIADVAALAPLRALAESRRHAMAERLEAVDAIALVGGPARGQALLRLLADPQVRLRLRVVQALGRVGDGAVVLPLRRHRVRERDAAVREALDRALAEIRERRAPEGSSPAAPAAPPANAAAAPASAAAAP